MVAYALSLLLQGAGYEISMVEPPAGRPEDLMEGMALLLIPPGLVRGRSQESLAALREMRERMGVAILSLSSAVNEGLFHDEKVEVVPWPINFERLAREIEGALRNATGRQGRAWRSRVTASSGNRGDPEEVQGTRLPQEAGR